MSSARSRRRRALTAAVAVAAVLGAATPHGAMPVAASSDATAFVAVPPCRLLDTRDGTGPVGAGGTVDVDVAGRCGVAAGAVAAVVTVAAVLPEAAGFVTAFPTGSSRPLASSLNYRAGQVIVNGQLAALGDGSLSLYTLARSHLVVDVSGYFAAAPGGAAAGRLIVDGPRRVADTRLGGRPAAGGSVRVDPGVPGDATAVVVNITTTETNGPDHFTAHAAGTARPLASVLNSDAPAQTRGAATIVPVSADGFDVYTKHGNHVIVDLVGYFTGPSATVSTDGLYVPAAPARLADTRLERGPGGGPRLWDGGTRAFDPTLVTGAPVAAIAGTATMTATEDAGYVTMFAAGGSRPGTASVNADRAQATIANLVVAPVSTSGLAAYSLHGTHLVVDVGGWFLGEPLPDGGVPARNDPSPPRLVTIIGDSAIAGIRWNGALGGFQGFEVRHRLESCRRLQRPSCGGREGYAPRTVVNEILALPAVGPEEILVVATGYNDWHEGFASDFEAVVGAARSRGFHHIAWLTYRSHVGYRLPGSGGTRSNYGEMNAILAAKVASGAFPEVRVWDLDRYTFGAPGWFTSDGVHETVVGSWGVADYISRQVRAFDDLACAQPWRPGEATPDPCPNPDLAFAERGRADVVGLYGL